MPPKQNRLSGSIPDSWYELSMVALDLSFNRFTGPLPSTLGHAASLQAVLMAGNVLTGTLPDSWRNLRSAMRVDLSGVQLDVNAGLPPWLELSRCWLWLLVDASLRCARAAHFCVCARGVAVHARTRRRRHCMPACWRCLPACPALLPAHSPSPSFLNVIIAAQNQPLTNAPPKKPGRRARHTHNTHNHKSFERARAYDSSGAQSLLCPTAQFAFPPNRSSSVRLPSRYSGWEGCTCTTPEGSLLHLSGAGSALTAECLLPAPPVCAVLFVCFVVVGVCVHHRSVRGVHLAVHLVVSGCLRARRAIKF
jgi:hypothetical protein